MAELLEKTNSSYFPSFKNIFRDVVAGKNMSIDNQVLKGGFGKGYFAFMVKIDSEVLF